MFRPCFIRSRALPLAPTRERDEYEMSMSNRPGMGLGRALLDALAPTECLLCGSQTDSAAAPFGGALCARCSAELPWWREVDGCPRCGALRPAEMQRGAACHECLASGSPLHTCHALFRYAGPLCRWIPGVKRSPSVLGASVDLLRVFDQLARSQATSLALLVHGRLDLITCVPAAPRSLRRRGFNHVDPLSSRLAERWGLPHEPGLLVRAKNAPAQASLHGAARRQNLRGAFRATRTISSQMRIGLVDDVLTTGATLEAAAETLLAAGAYEVRAVTLAATLPRRRRPHARAASKTPPVYALGAARG